ncbi:protein of unknown function [Streptomyces sp. DvalAA-14]|uniref:DUF397 domain-containing protein n=1 Tax=unclassified Streptomyces TaxID=2593676 RepID=UPI00081AEE7B|nr:MULTISPECIES: DUF397 domain-containing protein [unclassified Streptomyces]MYS22215.1 DUF397 domain-containing protein [Streptomyces sp. SID4948]SCE11372.1 protein of unknown function [Streptomyces sp. DvalAA-14]
MTTEPSANSPAELHWCKSTHSSNEGPDCVEVAASPGAVHVRDSKDPAGPRLAFSPAAWTAFVAYAAEREGR